MNKVATAFLALALCIPAIAFAQNSGQQDDKNLQQQQNQKAQANQMGVDTQEKKTMSGTVSNQGKSFTSGNTTYMVSNPGKLKGRDNQTVSVEFRFNTDNNTIRITSVSPAQ